LQNIPVRTESGKAIREIFVPAPGKLFLASDYSQIELRVMAHMSGDDSMIEAFRRDHDIHKATASEMFGVRWIRLRLTSGKKPRQSTSG